MLHSVRALRIAAIFHPCVDHVYAEWGPLCATPVPQKATSVGLCRDEVYTWLSR